MGMVVIQPCISMSKLIKTKTKFLRCTGYLNSIKTLLNKIYISSKIMVLATHETR